MGPRKKESDLQLIIFYLFIYLLKYIFFLSVLFFFLRAARLLVMHFVALRLLRVFRLAFFFFVTSLYIEGVR